MKKENIKYSFTAKGEEGYLISQMWHGQSELFFKDKNNDLYRLVIDDLKITINDDFAVLRLFNNGEKTLDYNDKLLGLEEKLKSYILHYKKLLKEFNNRPDRFSSSSISKKSKEISNRFFHFMEFLVRSIDDFPNDKEYEVAVKWRDSHKRAEICPTLVINNQVDRAAEIMAELNKAEQEMFNICEEEKCLK